MAAFPLLARKDKLNASFEPMPEPHGLAVTDRLKQA
jgi:hypothetical protein